MAFLDDTQLIFASTWPINQQVLHTTKTVSVPGPKISAVQIQDFASIGITTMPRFFASWRPTGQTHWFMNGTDSALGSGISVYVFAKPDGLYAYGAGATEDIRYTIYKDPAVIA